MAYPTITVTIQRRDCLVGSDQRGVSRNMVDKWIRGWDSTCGEHSGQGSQ